MCTWQQFCRFAREPEPRKVGIDARVTIIGTTYELEPDMAGETVILLWGLFDDELYAEFEGERFGPYYPVSGPVPLHRYRAFKRSKADDRRERIRNLAAELGLPIAALAGDVQLEARTTLVIELPHKPFDVQAQEYCYPNVITAKLAIADELARPLAALPPADRAFIDDVLSETLVRRIVLTRIRDYFHHRHLGEDYAR